MAEATPLRPAALPPTPLRFYRSAAAWGWCIILVFIGGLGAWAALAPLEYGAMAPGAVIAQSRTKPIQHLEGGIVRSILVRDGDEVTRGQVLVTLDDTKARAQIATIDAQLWDGEARRARLVAQRDEKDAVAYPPELLAHRDEPAAADAIQGQENIFRTFNLLYRSKLDSQDERIAQLEQQVAGEEAEEGAARREIALINEQLAGTRFLAAKGLERKATLIGLERDLAASEGRASDILASISRDKLAIAQSRLDVLSFKHDTQSKIADDMRSTETSVLALVEQRRAAAEVLDRTAIRAPEDGTVTDLQVHTLGGVVTAGQTVLNLVPRGDTLVVEARVRPEDIDRVVVGSPGNVRLLPYSQRRTPPVAATVIYVSADRLTDKKTEAPYYAVRLKLDPERLSELPEVKVLAGMPAEAMIKTGETTVALYAFAPILDTFHKAFRAR
jgi:HlyD family secretion protein